MSGPIIYSKADIAKHDAMAKKAYAAEAKRNRERYQKKSKKKNLANAIGLAKSIAGMCVDEESHQHIERRVRELIGMLYVICDRSKRRVRP